MPRRARRKRAHVAPREFDLAQHFAPARHDHLTDAGQFKRVADPAHYRYPERVFDLRDLLRNGWLRDVKCGRHPRDLPEVGQAHEYPQMRQFQSVAKESLNGIVAGHHRVFPKIDERYNRGVITVAEFVICGNGRRIANLEPLGW
jgi:hypothetical protein